MNYHLAVRPEVLTDLAEAEAWYESQQPGLGRDFLREVRTKLLYLRDYPTLARVRHRRHHVRWVYPRRFPYRIVYRITSDTVVVFGVIHAARHDREWRRRI